jgi:hypothetical protein
MTDNKIIRKTRIMAADEAEFTVQHYDDGAVMISQPGGFDGTERVYIPANMVTAFMAVMERPA